jgi:SnoaL-like domain
MQEHEVRELFERLREAMDPELEYRHRHEDYLLELPQSGERMDRDGLRRLQTTFPPEQTPRIRLRRVTGSGDVWFFESLIHYADGKVFHGVSRVELRDGRMWRETRYYAEPFEVPAWRASWSKPVVEEPVAG